MRHQYFHNNSSQITQLLQQIVNDGIKIKDNFWENVVIQASGAFFGALFAFLFGLLMFWIQKKRERFNLHKNAVVELEYLLWEHYDLNFRNKMQVQNSISILKKQNHLTYNRFYILRMPIGLDLKLADLEIINLYATYLLSVDRINSGINTLNRVFEIWSQMLLMRQPPSGEEINHVIGQMEELTKILGQFDSETEELLSIIRVYLRRLDDRKEKGFNIYKLNGYSKITEEEKKRERKKMDKEIKENSEKYKKEARQ